MNKKKFKIDWAGTMDKIREQGSKKTNNSYKDERIYYPQFNENDTAQAIIRFLPSPDTDIPFVSVYSHSIQGAGWYIENCPTTIKKECPACKANTAIWESDPDTARKRKRKQSYYSNILIIKDPANPENEGKVFLYKYGKKVYDKIMSKIDPGSDSIEEPIMVFDYYDGADFKLIIKKIQVGKYKMPNYDDSQFSAPSPVGTDDEIEKYAESLYNLSEFTAPENFKSFDELQTKFERVTGVTGVESNNSTPRQNRPTSQTTEVPKVADEGVFEGTDDEFFTDLQKED